MDWSLLEPNDKHFLLRTHLGYPVTFPYYIGLVLDPILRFSWIFYAIFRSSRQQGAALSYAIAFAEVLRRFMWNFFRVENEHVTNVGRFRAVRDVPLPFDRLPQPSEEENEEDRDEESEVSTQQHEVITNLAAAGKPSPKDSLPVRRRRSFRRTASMLRGKHAEDFERRKDNVSVADVLPKDADDDDDDDDESRDGYLTDDLVSSHMGSASDDGDNDARAQDDAPSSSKSDNAH